MSMRVLVLVPARGGSKGVPGKNLKPVAGISLVGHAVRVGLRFLRAGGHAGDVVIDTDSESIAAEAKRWGADAPFLRPAELATDGSPTIDSTLHTLDRLEASGRRYDVLVLLQPTSPLRELQDVSACFDAYDPNRQSAISIVAPDHPPAQAMTIAADGALDWQWPQLRPDRQRQSHAPVYRPSGAVYVSSVESLRATRAFIVPGRTRGVLVDRVRSIDIDSAEDLAIAQTLAERRVLAPLSLGGRSIGRGQPCFAIVRALRVASAAPAAIESAIASLAQSGARGLRLDRAELLQDGASAAQIEALLRCSRERGWAVLEPAPDVAGADAGAQPRGSLRGDARGGGEGGRMRGDARGGGEGTSTRGDVPAGGEGASVRGEARGGGEGTSTRGDVPGGGEGASLRAAAQPGEEGTSERTASRADADGWVVAAGALRDAARLAALAGAGRPLLLETAALDAPELDRVLLALSEQGAPPLALLHAPGPRIGSRGRADQMTVGATLAQMRELQSAFGLVTGFAATEPAFAVAAAALEAPLVELAVDLGDRAQLTLVAAALRAIGNLTAAEPATDGAA